ncbi:unnamed protein product, partial [Cercopithifilaria johnstoni]
VSSTTNEFYDRLGIKGLVSDQFDARKHIAGSRSMNTSSSTSLFERAVNESASNCVEEPVFRVRISELERWKPRSRINIPTQPKFTGAIRKRSIQRSTVPIKNTARSIPNTRQIAGRIRPSVFNRLG